MPLSATLKKQVIKEFQTADGDTGSPEVQIALLTKRLDRLTGHLKNHLHDTHSRRGLLSMIAKRRRLINFLTKIDKKRASAIEKKIGFEKPRFVPISGTAKEQTEKTKKVKKIAKTKQL